MDLTQMKEYFPSSYRWGNVQVGSAHGEIPTIPIGSIFYMGHKLVKDPATGDFDEIAVGELIEKCDNTAKMLGIRYILDVIGNTPEALVKYVTFLKKVTDAPLLVNASLADVRIDAMKLLADKGFTDLGYNSIGGFSTDEEIEALSELPVEAAVIQAYAKGKKRDAALSTLVGDRRCSSLLEKAYRAGISKVMVDIPTLDMSSIGSVPHSARIIRETIDLPCGTASSNATYASPILRDRSRMSLQQFRCVDASVNSYLASQGCAFTLMGPLSGYEWVFPAMAFANAYHVYGLRPDGVNPATENHPLYQVI